MGDIKQFYDQFNTLSEEDQMDVINEMSDEDAQALLDYENSLTGQGANQSEAKWDNSNDLLTPEQAEKVERLKSPPIPYVPEGKISGPLGGGTAAKMLEDAANLAIGIPNTVYGITEGVASLLGQDTDDVRLQKEYEFENKMDREGIKGTERLARKGLFLVTEGVAQGLRSPLLPGPGKIKAAKGFIGGALQIAKSAIANGALATLYEGLAQVAEATGTGEIDADKRIEKATGTGARTAMYSAALGASGKLLGAGLGKVAKEYEKSKQAERIIGRIDERVQKATKEVDQAKGDLAKFEIDASDFNTQITRVTQGVKRRKAELELGLERETMRLLNQTKQAVLKENQALQKKVDFYDRDLAKVEESFQKSTLKSVELLSDSMQNIRSVINKNYDKILKGRAGLKKIDVSSYLPELQDNLNRAAEDDDVARTFLGVAKKIFPGVSFNSAQEAAETLARTEGNLTVNQVHLLRVALKDLARRKMDSGVFYNQMLEIEGISDKLGDEISAIDNLYSKNNALYGKYADTYTFMNRYVGSSEKSYARAKIQGKQSTVRFGVRDAVDEYVKAAKDAEKELSEFFKGNGDNLKPISKLQIYQTAKIESLYRQVDMLRDVGLNKQADNLSETLSTVAKKSLQKDELIRLKNDTLKFIEANPDKKAKALLENSPEMLQLKDTTDKEIAKISDQLLAQSDQKLSMRDQKVALQRGIEAAKDKVSQVQQKGEERLSKLPEGILKTRQQRDKELLGLNNSIIKVGWTSNNQLIKRLAFNLTGWTSLTAYGPEYAAMAKKGIESMDSYIKSKNIEQSTRAAWSYLLRATAEHREKWEQEDQEALEELRNSQ